jgi:hypothetical protein
MDAARAFFNGVPEPSTGPIDAAQLRKSMKGGQFPVKRADVQKSHKKLVVTVGASKRSGLRIRHGAFEARLVNQQVASVVDFVIAVVVGLDVRDEVASPIRCSR